MDVRESIDQTERVTTISFAMNGLFSNSAESLHNGFVFIRCSVVIILCHLLLDCDSVRQLCNACPLKG